MPRIIIFALLFILISCGGESSNAPASEEDPKGSEIPCDEQNEGLIIKPADSETERLCKDGAWVELPSSSESVSSSSDVSSSSLEASSSSITSSSSSLDISSSSAETEGQISSSSEETKMFLCEDGVTYVLDLANCDVESSSSDALSSSSEEDSSSSLSSSSSVVSSSATLSSSSEDSSSSENVSSSSSSATSSSSERSSSSIDSSSSNVASSSSSESSSSVTSSSSVDSSSSSSGGIPSKLYDCSKYKCVTTKYLNPEIDYGELLDERDSLVYRTVQIGEQVWMAQNLNYKPKEEKSYCMDNVEDSCSVYGRFYPFSVAMDSLNQGGCGYGGDCQRNVVHQGICPNGWHLPDSTEIATFMKYIKNEYDQDSLSAIKADSTWKYSYLGTNKSGFSLLGSGRYIFSSIGYSDLKGEHTYLWGNGWSKYASEYGGVYYGDMYIGGCVSVQKNGFYYIRNLGDGFFGTDLIYINAYNVRCLKNPS